MEKFILSTDSCCDELKSNLKKNGIEYIPMSFICGEEIYQDKFDSIEEYQEFYEEMRKGKPYSTTGLNPFELREYYEGILKEKQKDIIHITLSSALSGTYQVAKDVAEEINLTSKYKIYVLDSLSATQGQNLLLNYGKKIRDEGKSAEEAFEILKDISKKIYVYFFLNDLETLKRGGRLNGAQAVMAKIMQLRPILRFNSKGELEVTEKVIGARKAIRSLADIFFQNYDSENDMPPFLTFSGEPTNAMELRSIIENKTGKMDIICKPVGPVICSHTGPSLTGIIFVSKSYRK